MKNAKLVIGIISIVLSLFVLLQSCAAGVLNAMSSNGQTSGSAGLIVALFFIIAGIIGIATRKSTGKAGTLTSAGFYFGAALIGSLSAGNYKDLYVWAFVSFAFGAVYIVDAFYDRYPDGEVAKWWQKPWVITLLLIVFPPAGIVLLWLCKKIDLVPKIIMTIIFAIAFLIMITSFSGSSASANNASTAQNSGSSSTAKQETKVYGPGETWTVDGEFSLTFTSAAATADRNQFSDKTPAQVVVLNYDYANIGVVKSVQDLYISSSQFKVIDANGEMASTYPATTAGSPQPTPIGAKSVGCQCAYGLNNPSPEVTVNVEVYGNNYKAYDAVFKLPVQ